MSRRLVVDGRRIELNFATSAGGSIRVELRTRGGLSRVTLSRTVTR